MSYNHNALLIPIGNSSILGRVVPEQQLLIYLEKLLRDELGCSSFSSYMNSYFREFFYPEEAETSTFKLGFSLWENRASHKMASLVSAAGFDFGSDEYPKILNYGDGIVGTILEQLATHSNHRPYVSLDYTQDSHLAASRLIIERFGFRSGIAFPIIVGHRLYGIFKLYCSTTLDPSVKEDSARLESESLRISLFFHLLESHVLRGLHSKIENRFSSNLFSREGDSASYRLDDLRKTLIGSLHDLVQIIGASKAIVKWDNAIFAEAHFNVQAIIRDTKENLLRVRLPKQIDAKYDGPSQLEIYHKVDGTCFSQIDVQLVNEAEAILSKHLIAMATMKDVKLEYEGRLSAQQKLLQRSEKLSLDLLNAASVDEIIEKLLSGIAEEFAFSALLFLQLDGRVLRPRYSVPKSMVKQLLQREITLQLPAKCKYAESQDWTIADCVACGQCHALTAIACVRKEPINVNDVTDSKIAPLFYDLGVKTGTEVIAPVAVPAQIYGVLDFYRAGIEAMGEGELYFLRSICNVAALGIYSLSLTENLHSHYLEEARGEMARDVVHTLTADISALLTHVELLKKRITAISTKARDRISIKQYVGEALESAEMLLDTVRGQANISQTYGSATIKGSSNIGDVWLWKIVEDVIRITSFSASRKRVQILRPEIGRRRVIRALEQDMFLIVWNLVNNAIKFSRGIKPSKVTILTSYSDDYVSVSVKDQGIGIPEENRSHIWIMGYSTPAPGETRQTSGLGLYTVSELINRMESADISVTSHLGRGSEFILTIKQRGKT